MTDFFGGETDSIVRFLQGLALLLFISAGVPLLAGRRLFRRASIVVYLAVLALVLALIGAWIAGSR